VIGYLFGGLLGITAFVLILTAVKGW